MFSKITLKCLQAAGWSDDYKANVENYVIRAKQKDCVIPSIVEDFLQHFGLLTIRYPSTVPKDVREKFGMRDYQEFHFDVDKTDADCNDLESLATRINSGNLYYVGELGGHLLLLMSQEGKVYSASYDEKLVYFIANSGEEAIEIICTNQDTPQIDV